MHIIVHSDEINKIEVRNKEKYPLFAVFHEVFFSMGNHSIFICCPNRTQKLDIICKIKNKIDFIHGNYSMFFVFSYFFKILRVNYLCTS